MMPELLKDVFGDPLATETFFSGKSRLDHDHVDHHSLQDEQKFFSGSNYSFQDTFKPPHDQKRQKILSGMSTMSPVSLSERDAFLRHASSFLRLEIDTCHDDQFQHDQKHQHNYPQQQQQTVSSFLPGSGILHEQSLQLEVPENEEYNTSWMSEVLNDFPAITTEAEPPTMASLSNVSFDRIPPNHNVSSTPGPVSHQIPMSAQQLRYTALQLSLEDRSRTARFSESKSTTGPTNSLRIRNQGVKIPKAPGLRGRDVSYNLLEHGTTALEPFNPRGSVSRRYQRLSEKSKDVSQIDHVQRERQRRNNMSLKISTLENLLPPLGHNLKRDRAAIVHDSVQYLKSLQERVRDLKRTSAEMKLKISRPCAARQTAALKKGNPELLTSSDGKSKLVEYYIQVEGDGEAPLRLEKCRCRSDFMSSAMKILEYFNLDVCRCAVTKMFDYTILVIIAKPRSVASNQVPSSASVVSAFRSCLQLS